MTAALIWDPALADYRFAASHPMRPERFTLAVELMRAWGLLAESTAGDPRARTSAGERDRAPAGPSAAEPRASVLRPRPASISDLRLFHSAAYVNAVRNASKDPRQDAPAMGLGDSDTPTFSDMHEAAALAVGATMLGLDSVLDGRVAKAFNPAGGLHHAHRESAAGFCIYNDCAIAIERATRSHEGLHVAYVDIDAHHGDGVEEAFHTRSDVLTLSVHESGRYLFPGTGHADDIGEGGGVGFTLNVPLPPGADAACYDLAFVEIIRPALRHFHPDVIVAQIGADSNVADPLTHLTQTVEGQLDLVAGIIRCADELCGGRIVLTGGGGYEPFSVVPRIWAGAMALLLGRDVPTRIPASWIERARDAAASHGIDRQLSSATFDQSDPLDKLTGNEYSHEAALVVTQSAINRVRHASLLLGGGR